MVNILNIKKDIVNVLLYLNLISLMIIILASSKTYFIVAIIINIILSGTLILMNKCGDSFMAQFNKMWNK